MDADARIPTPVVGRVLRASASEFTLGCHALEAQIPHFGTFVRVLPDAPFDPTLTGVVGVVADLRVEDDPFVRQLITAEVRDEYINDQRQRRQVPIEVRVIHAGYFAESGSAVHALPPVPPLALERIHACTAEEVRQFCRSATARGPSSAAEWQFGFLSLLFESEASDSLLAAVVLEAARAQGPERRQAFLVEAGRELASLLAGDLSRLQRLLLRLGEG